MTTPDTVTTVMVTIVHPADTSGESVADSIQSWVMRHAPSDWGIGSVVPSSGVAVRTTEDDVPEWRDPREPA